MGGFPRVLLIYGTKSRRGAAPPAAAAAFSVFATSHSGHTSKLNYTLHYKFTISIMLKKYTQNHKLHL